MPEKGLDGFQAQGYYTNRNQFEKGPTPVTRAHGALS